jgi:hypothetical protein
MTRKAGSLQPMNSAGCVVLTVVAIACLCSRGATAADIESLSVFDSLAGHSGPVTPAKAPAAGTAIEHRVVPVGRHPFGPSPAVKDPALQTTPTTLTTPSGSGFNGIGVSSGYQVQYIPPDTNGAAGDTQYVQFVNASYAVLDKQTGNFCENVNGQASCAQPNTSGRFFRLSALFKAAANFPQNNPCATRDDGDPVVVFDRVAHRWILSQFAVPNGGGYHHCVAVSQTNDATGGYYVYAFQQPYFPDYPKMGVWPDGYYTTFNMFRGGRFLGARVCVYERSQMLAGASARQLCSSPNSSYGSLLPSDLDGKSSDLNPSYVSPSSPGDIACSAGPACPPAGTPNVLANFSGGFLQTGFVTVNWLTGSGTISWPQRVTGAASFTPACNGGACTPQPDTNQKLDSLGDRLMFRLAYSRPCVAYSSTPGQCQTWDPSYHTVVSQSVAVDPGTSTVTGIRWYDVLPAFSNVIVGSSATLTTRINQQSTFSPDSDYRWMSSIAMDRAGNIAVGYSRAGTTRYPSIAVALGPVASRDIETGEGITPLSVESIIMNGTGSQTSYSRWGDYASMSVDPVDGCTLWFTSQYQTVTGVFDWSTRIYSTRVSSSCQ